MPEALPVPATPVVATRSDPALAYLGPHLPTCAGAGGALLIEEDDEHTRCWTREALARAIDSVAVSLHALGLPRGSRVGLVAWNCAELLIAYFALLRAGLVAVPLNHRMGRDIMGILLDDSAVQLVLADDAHASSLPRRRPVVRFGSKTWQDWCGRPRAPLPTLDPEDEAAIIYTSGSSGRPKGVPLTHRGQQWTTATRMALAPVRADETMLVAAPLYHTNALGNCVLALALGISLVLQARFEARAFLGAIARRRVTWVTGVPAMLAMSLADEPTWRGLDLGTVRTLRLASAPLGEALARRIAEAFPGARLINAYGTTEAGLVPFGPGPQGQPVPPLALGWPHPAVGVRLRDEQGRPADEGVLWVRGPATMSGYLHLPELNRQVLDAERWYCTGDRMRRDAQGAYHFIGRADDMMVCGGENVYPAQVERLLERHPAVAQACVVPLADEIKGQKPVAFVVLHDGAQCSAQALRDFALANGPAYQHPRHVILLPRLPLASTQKIDRAALTAMARERLQ